MTASTRPTGCGTRPRDTRPGRVRPALIDLHLRQVPGRADRPPAGPGRQPGSTDGRPPAKPAQPAPPNPTNPDRPRLGQPLPSEPRTPPRPRTQPDPPPDEYDPWRPKEQR